MLKFSKENAKIRKLKEIGELKTFLSKGKRIYSIDLLSGHFCPFAQDCLSKAIYKNGKGHIEDGPLTKFRCYSASAEAQYPNVYKLRKHNSDTLRNAKTTANMESIITRSIPSNAGIVRLHSAGDFFNQAHFDAWLGIAKQNPKILFYAYTKSLPYWIKRLNSVESIPNLVLTASYGGRKDSLIDEFGLRAATVVFSEKQAAEKHLEIDHDDSHAARPSLKNQSFALLIHGTQPPKTEAAKALSELGGKGSYNRKDN